MNTRRRSYIVVMLGVFLWASATYAQTGINAASEAYRKGDFRKSIELYEGIVAQHLDNNKESAEIYYNLGNAYFRDNQVAKAILNYERALLLNPGDSDIRHNLRFARTRIEDKVDISGNMFLTSWAKAMQNMYDSDTWGKVGIGFFVLLLIFVGIYLFIRVLWIKKAAFYVAIVFFFLVIVANLFAFEQKDARVRRNSGIVMAAAVSVRTSPDANSKELFQLHEGTKIKVRDTDGNWYEIQIANGSVGWLPKENVEII